VRDALEEVAVRLQVRLDGRDGGRRRAVLGHQERLDVARSEQLAIRLSVGRSAIGVVMRVVGGIPG
jgi:hypothetical protein